MLSTATLRWKCFLLLAIFAAFLLAPTPWASAQDEPPPAERAENDDSRPGDNEEDADDEGDDEDDEGFSKEDYKELKEAYKELKEELDELDEELEEVKAEGEPEEIAEIERHIAALKELKPLYKERGEAAKALYKAHKEGDDEAIEQAEIAMEKASIAVWKVELKMMLGEFENHRKHLTELTADLKADNDKRAADAEKLIGQLPELTKLVQNLIKHADDPEEAEELEEQFEPKIDAFEKAMGILHVTLEIESAKEEGDDELVKELEEELEQIKTRGDDDEDDEDGDDN